MNSIKSRCTLSRAIAALLFGGGILSASAVQAANETWDGGAGTGTAWFSTANWVSDTGFAGSQSVTTNSDIATFTATGTGSPIGINMNFTGNKLYLGAIDMTGNTARLIGNSSSTAGTLVLNGATVNSVANTILRNTSTSLMTIQASQTGTMGLELGNATTNVIQITNTGGITISSNISGIGGITRQGAGAGTLTLSGNNNYTGVTAISGGPVAISNSNALGATGSGNNTTIAATGATNGPRLLVSGGINSPENITLTGTTEVTGFAGAIQNTSGTNTLSGNITLAGTGGLKISAPGGTLNLTGNITQTSTTNTLVLQPFAATAVINVSNPIAINGGGLLLVGVNGTAGATVTLSGASGSGIGATTLGQNVTLRLGVNDALNTTANLTISYGGTTTGEDRAVFDLRGFNQTVNALIGNVGTGASPAANSLRLVTNGVAGTSVLTVGNGGGSGTFRGQINSGTGDIQLIKVGAGNQTLIDQNSYTGGTRIDGGTLTLGHATNTLANTGAINVNGGTLALGANSDTVGAVTLTSGSITGTTGVLTGSSYAVESGSVSAILGGAGIGLSKSTIGTVTLSGNNTYTGVTTVSAGRLVVNGSTTSDAVVSANGTLGGSGTIGGTITVNGGTLSPGSSIESLASGSNIWTGAMGFDFEFSTDGATGAAGSEWDLLAITGSLDLTGVGVGGVDLNLITMATASTAGMLGSWDPNANHTWAGFITTTTGFTGFDPNKFSFDTTGFQNTLNGNFSVVQNGNNLDLQYSVIPEPSTLVLGGLALLGLAGAGLRKRRLAK